MGSHNTPRATVSVYHLVVHLLMQLKSIIFLPLPSSKRTNDEVFCRNVLNTYTHALVHVPTAETHQAITAEDTRTVMVLSSWVTAGRAPGQLGRTWSWRTRSKPGSRGTGLWTRVLLLTGLLALPANCPSHSLLLQLLGLEVS